MKILEDRRNIVYTDQKGNIDAVMVQDEILLETSLGPLTPIYSVIDYGRKELRPIKLFGDNQIKSIPLQVPTPIKTSIGTYTAELVTFHPNGALKRLFPITSRLSGNWSEMDLYKIAPRLTIPTALGKITAKTQSLQFYKTGELKSITFWPKEIVSIPTLQGGISVRNTVSFYKNGNIASCEPTKSTIVSTPIGKMSAYGSEPERNDLNSLAFNEKGEVEKLLTVKNMVSVINLEGMAFTFTPGVIPGKTREADLTLQPLKVIIKKDFVQVKRGMMLLGRFSRLCQFYITPIQFNKT